MPRIEELITFCQVVEQKSFSRAAELLGVSQPAVSLQIKSLENEYETILLNRGGIEVIPTESGQAVYKFATRVSGLYEKSREQVRELEGRPGGKLRVGASTGPGEHLLPVLLGQFKQQRSEVEVALRVADSSTVIDQVFQHQLELGFVGTARRDRYLNFQPFFKDQLVVVTYQRILGPSKNIFRMKSF